MIAAACLAALLASGCSLTAVSGPSPGPPRPPVAAPAGPPRASATVPVGPRLARSIHFSRVWRFTRRHGFALTVRGRMLWTADGGRRWYDATPSGVRATVYGGVGFAPGTTAARPGWAVTMRGGQRILLVTSNGGMAWRRRALPAFLQHAAILGMAFVGPADGWLLTSGTGPAGRMNAVLYRTADGGLRWSEVARTAAARPSKGLGLLPPAGLKSGIAFSGVRNGWVTGTTATPGRIFLLGTRDGGRRWSTREIGAPGSLPDAQLQSQPPVFFGHGRGVLAVQRLGRIPPTEVLFFTTRDGGLHWSAAGAAIDQDPSAFGFVWDFSGPAHGWAADGAHLYATRDGGHRWTPVPAKTPLREVSQLEFVSATDGWAVSGGRLLATTDGGRVWTSLSGAAGS